MESIRETKTDANGFNLIASDDRLSWEPNVFGSSANGDDFGSGFKTCKECGKPKSLLEFRVEPKGVGGRKAVCKACMGTETRKAYKRGNVSNDMIKAALEAAAYRIILERM